MNIVFGSLYLVFFLGCFLVVLFIAYHIVRYSMSRATMLFGLTLFLSVASVLLLSNAVLFLSLPLHALLAKTF